MSATAPRGLAPSPSEGAWRVARATSTTYPATSGETCTSRTARRPASMSAEPATAMTPDAATSWGSKPDACRLHDLELLSAVGDGQHDLEQEPVELGLGEGIGAFVLDRVLGGGDEERPRQRARTPSTETWPSSIASSSADCVLGGVRLISSASSRLVKTGPSRNDELAAAAVDHHRAGDVAGHQVRRELHPTGLHRQGGRQAAHEQRLGDARHALHEHMAAAQERDQQAGHGGVLADHGLGHLGTHGAQALADVVVVGAGRWWSSWVGHLSVELGQTPGEVGQAAVVVG